MEEDGMVQHLRKVGTIVARGVQNPEATMQEQLDKAIADEDYRKGRPIA